MSDPLPTGLLTAMRQAGRVVVLTGAGASAESGVPTFRDAQTGLWSKFRPEDLATTEAFRAHPQRVWQWYAWRRELIAKVSPNAGHLALATMANLYDHFTLITQNVDGLHQRAGNDAVVEFHGNINIDRCLEEHRILDASERHEGEPPTCQHCGGLVRPGVVWFGEAIDPGVLENSYAATAACDVFITAGTAAEVYPAAGLIELAVEQGATTIEINPQVTPCSHLARFAIRGRCAEVLPSIVNQLS